MDYFPTDSKKLLKRERPGEFPGRVSKDLTSAKITDKKGKAFIALFWSLARLSSSATFSQEHIQTIMHCINFYRPELLAYSHLDMSESDLLL